MEGENDDQKVSISAPCDSSAVKMHYRRTLDPLQTSWGGNNQNNRVHPVTVCIDLSQMPAVALHRDKVPKSIAEHKHTASAAISQSRISEQFSDVQRKLCTRRVC